MRAAPVQGRELLHSFFWTRPRDGRVGSRVPAGIATNLPSTLFSALVLVTAGISYRWGSMVGLIFFVFALMTGVVVVSHLALR